MIDWERTQTIFGYNTECLWSYYRPKVVCNCDGCGKEKIITIRVKSKINSSNQINWKCPSCVGKSISNDISLRMKDRWDESKYRQNQLKIKHGLEYKQNASEAARIRWENKKYREQFSSITSYEFIKRAVEINGDSFNYDNTTFVNWKTKISFFCNSCKNTSCQSPYNHLTIPSCKFCVTSSGQRSISDYIISLGYNVILNDRNSILPFEIDVFIPTLKFGIEYHGYYWHSYDRLENTKERNNNSKKRVERKRRLD